LESILDFLGFLLLELPARFLGAAPGLQIGLAVVVVVLVIVLLSRMRGRRGGRRRR